LSLPLIARARRDTVPIERIAPDAFTAWRKAQPKATQAWLDRLGVDGSAGDSALLPDGDGARAVVVVEPDADLWAWGKLASDLPRGSYRLTGRLSRATADRAALGWALAGYRFTRYRTVEPKIGELVWPTGADRKAVTAAAEATALVRDLINTPADDMGPSELAAAARKLAKGHGAKVTVTSGANLRAGYPAIHAVGRASDDGPRLIDLRWGRPRDPKVTLVGKGVCFDTGGLDLKPAGGMKLMKKDMGGAAQVLGVAHMVMAAGLRVRLRVLIPAVENAVAGNALRPLDVVKTRKGLTVEIGNTDAEGRVVLSDCLHEASRENPDLIVDFATLSGAARVALGTGLPALFAGDDALADDILAAGRAAADPLWRLPLHRPYRKQLDSKVADLNNIGGGFGGAITAALFLDAFVEDGIPWAHIDLMAWNPSAKPGRPEGGEAMGMRAVYGMLEKRYGG